MLGKLFQWLGRQRPGVSAARSVAEPETCLSISNTAQAAAALDKAELMFQEDADTLALKGSCLGQEGDIEQAIHYFRRALEIVPGHPVASLGMGNIAMLQKRFDAAADAYATYLAAEHGNLAVTRNLAFCLNNLGRWDEMAGPLEEWIRAEPTDIDAHYHQALLYFSLGQTEQLENCLHRISSLSPDHLESQYLNSHFQLLAGNFAQGWQKYEARIPLAISDGKSEPPRWDGVPLQKGSLLVSLEQGSGDVIMFARFLPEIQERAPNMILRCRQAMLPLLQNSFPDIRIVSEDSAIPSINHPVIWHPLLSTPLKLNKFTLEDYAMTGSYLSPPEDNIRRLSGLIRQNGKKRIGLVWQGNTDRPDFTVRSIPEAAINKLVREIDADWYSLQLGCSVPSSIRDKITNLAPHLKDFADTSAAIRCLDAVISIDTSVAHLSGALGQTTFVLEPYVNDWRWRMAGKPSPWYPTVRLFKADRDPAKRWDSAARELEIVLQDFCQSQQLAG